MPSFLDSLSNVQRRAAISYDGPALIIAGAGSGKTRVLTYRIAYMISQGVPAWNILALTFTNKAAKEMKERMGQVVEPSSLRGLWMGTFHSIFSRILRNEAELLGFNPNFTIYEPSDCRNVIKQIVKEMELNDEKYKPGDILSRISLAKNNLVTPEAYAANASLVAEDRERRMPEIREIYRIYMARCKQNGAMDFDDLLLYMNILLRDFPQALEKYQKQFSHILVDEYQDTNYAQYLIVKRLAQRHKNICVVGDDAQSIYSFRGAKIENILRFRNDYPEAHFFKLEENYRSTRNIVNAANSIIGKNTNQIKKESFSSQEEGELVKVVRCYTDTEEAIAISHDIMSTVYKGGGDYSDAAILYRTNAQSRVFEEALRKLNVPYRIYGGMSFYQRAEIKDILAYIRLIVNTRDDEALRRIINYPARGIGDTSVSRIAEAASARGISMWEAIETLSPAEMEVRGGAVKSLAGFVEMIRELAARAYTTDAYDFASELVARTGIIHGLKIRNTPEAVSTVENIEELLNSIHTFTQDFVFDQEYDPSKETVTIDEWLHRVSLLTDLDNEGKDDSNKVTLMTIHSAKGLEFKYVYVVGMEENLFPSQMCLTSPEGLEEERRLFYVAVTRAKKKATISFARQRFKWGETVMSQPSRFIGEIDRQYLDMPFEIDPKAPFMTGYEESNGEEEHGRFRGSGKSGASRYGSEPGGKGGRPDFRRAGEVSGNNNPVQRPQPTLGGNFKKVTSATRPARSSISEEELAEGARVSHEKFGRGTIAAIETAQGDKKVTVEFDDFGKKTLLLKFAKLEMVK